MPSPAAQPYFLAHPAPPLALQIRPVQVLHPQSALLSPVPYQTPFAPRAAPHAMKTLHHPAVIEVLASRVDDFHLPHIQQHYTPNPPHDSEDDIIRGNPDDPLTQLAAAAAVEHKQMLARERNLKVAQAEHELELRKKKDAMKLEKERLDWEKEKRELRESAALLQEKWRELHEMQQGLRPVTAPPPSLALLAGVGPMKTKRATTVKALPPKLDMQSLKVNSPATSTFVSTATLNGDDAPPQSSASSAEILPLGPMSAPAAAGALKRPFEAIEAHVAAHGTEPRKSPVKRQGSARKIEVVPVSALIQQRDSSAVFPSPTPASVTGTDGLLSMLTEAATAAALPLGDSPDGNESSGSEWGGDRSGAWAPGAQQAVPYRKRIGGHKRAGPGAGPKACFNCDTRKTTAWRRDLDGNLLCNPCALYKKYHGVNKPKPLMADQ